MSEKLTGLLVACMDENLDYGPGVVVLGAAGSLITKLGGGNQKVFPDQKRKLVRDTREAVYAGMGKVADYLKLPMYTTSHAGCGAGGAQTISGEGDLVRETSKMSKAIGVDYLGHIFAGDEPMLIGSSNTLAAYIGRDESNHYHGASTVIFTTGGGITEKEIRKIAERYQDGFVVSADWIGYALEKGDISVQQITEWLQLHLDIADGIADGVTAGPESVIIHDAKRLQSITSEVNTRYVNEMLSSI